MPRGERTTYREMKQGLPAPARRVVEELVERGQAPEEVLLRLAREEGCDIHQAYAYVREVLVRSLVEMTGAELAPPLRYAPPPARQPADTVAAL